MSRDTYLRDYDMKLRPWVQAENDVYRFQLKSQRDKTKGLLGEVEGVRLYGDGHGQLLAYFTSKMPLPKIAEVARESVLKDIPRAVFECVDYLEVLPLTRANDCLVLKERHGGGDMRRTPRFIWDSTEPAQ